MFIVWLGSVCLYVLYYFVVYLMCCFGILCLLSIVCLVLDWFLGMISLWQLVVAFRLIVCLVDFDFFAWFVWYC